MRKAKSKRRAILLVTVSITLLAGCTQSAPVPGVQTTPIVDTPTPAVSAPVTTPPPAEPEKKAAPAADPPAQTASKIVTVTNPAEITVLVNKRFRLPADYRPADLVEPKVPFIFSEWDEKRLMRKEPAEALERMFAAAKQDGIYLAGVSGYRSYATQESLFNYYVRVQGEEVARKYSAEPGHSEHQTGLAMDVSGSTGACAVEDCFADTPEAKWLAAHAHEFGFIIRYPEEKESITGYHYEPWHLRYVGKAMSQKVAASGLTLEEYLGKAR